MSKLSISLNFHLQSLSYPRMNRPVIAKDHEFDMMLCIFGNDIPQRSLAMLRP